jgi:hypothetical protein
MMKIGWDVEELVALIDIYRNSSEKSAAQIEKELLTLSYVLIRRANTLGIAHDEKFRNLNGMKMMYQNVIYLATEGEIGMSSVSSSMRKVYGLLLSTPEVFDLILDEFNTHYSR